MANRNETRETTLRQVDTLANLAKVGPVIRYDRDLVYVEENRSLYQFDVDASDAESSPVIIAPLDGAGRWFRCAAAEGVNESDYAANSILYATTAGVPVALTVGASTVVGRAAGGAIVALTATQLRTIANVEDGADVTDAANVAAAGALMASTTHTAPAAGADQITNTTDPTAFTTQYDLSGAVVGEAYKVKGMVVTPATHTTDEFGLDLKIGAGVTLASIAGFDVADGDSLEFDGEIIIAVIGASGKVHFRGTATKKSGSTVTTADFLLPDQAVDFTATPAIGLVGTWSAADVGNTADLRLLRVERHAAV